MLANSEVQLARALYNPDPTDDVLAQHYANCKIRVMLRDLCEVNLDTYGEKAQVEVDKLVLAEQKKDKAEKRRQAKYEKLLQEVDGLLKRAPRKKKS